MKNWLLVATKALLFSLSIFLYNTSCCNGGLFKHSSSPSPSSLSSFSTAQTSRKLFPQLRPHPDTRYLLELVTDDRDPVEYMDPVVKRLEEDLNTKVRKINIMRRPDFLTLFEMVGGNEGWSFPFFYNRRSGKAISGMTHYDNLLEWACGGVFHSFFAPPKQHTRYQGVRTTGIRDIFNEMVYKQSKKQKITEKEQVANDDDDYEDEEED